MLVTIATVVYNSEDLIEDTIKSVINQSYPDIEYIIIDGNSTDNTLEIINKYRDIIDILISEPDQGIYDGMNKAIDRASGSYILFMNSGDVFYYNDTVSDVFNSNDFNADKDDFIYGDYIWYYIGTGDKIYSKARPLEVMWQRISFSHQSLFSRTDLMKKHKFDLSYKVVADYENYFYHYKKGYSFRYLKIPIAIIRSGGYSEKELLRRTLERWKVVRKYDGSISRNVFYIKFIINEVIMRKVKMAIRWIIR